MRTIFVFIFGTTIQSKASIVQGKVPGVIMSNKRQGSRWYRPLFQHYFKRVSKIVLIKFIRVLDLCRFKDSFDQPKENQWSSPLHICSQAYGFKVYKNCQTKRRKRARRWTCGARWLQRCRAEGLRVWVLGKIQDHQSWTLQGAQEQRLPLWRIYYCQHHESHPGKNPIVCWYQVW